MTATDVAGVLVTMCIPVKQSPYGFDLGFAPDSYDNCRLERGGGIAGNSGRWHLVRVRDGEIIASCTTKRQLARLLREWLAGPKPQYPGRWFARINHRASGDYYIWVLHR